MESSPSLKMSNRPPSEALKSGLPMAVSATGGYTIQVEIHSLAEKGDRIKTILLFVLIAGIAFLQYATELSVHRQRLLYQGGLPIITLKE